jgi:HTH-type transcriptional regulator / antitoxin HipB
MVSIDTFVSTSADGNTRLSLIKSRRRCTGPGPLQLPTALQIATNLGIIAVLYPPSRNNRFPFSFSKIGVAGGIPCHRSLTSRNITVRSLYKMSPLGYSNDEGIRMRIRTIKDLGAYLRARRTQLGMDQATLASKAGTSRKWLVEVEHGKPGAELGLVLRTLRALDIAIDLYDDAKVQTSAEVQKPKAVAKPKTVAKHKAIALPKAAKRKASEGDTLRRRRVWTLGPGRKDLADLPDEDIDEVIFALNKARPRRSKSLP